MLFMCNLSYEILIFLYNLTEIQRYSKQTIPKEMFDVKAKTAWGDGAI